MSNANPFPVLICLLFLQASALIAQELRSFTNAPLDITRTITFTSDEEFRTHFDNSELFSSLYQRISNRSVKRPISHLTPEITLLPVVSGSVYNSRLPYAINSGPAWSGHGLSTSLSSGVGLRWLIFDVQIAPTHIISQNRRIDLPEDILSPDVAEVYYEPYRFYDRPALIDSGSVSRTYLGESWAKVSFGPVSAGVSNQNLWWGPGRRNSILMSNNAPGFNHATIHTNRPVYVGIGNLQFEYMAGRLERSYYNERPVRDYTDWRYLTALVVDFEPRFAPGLHVGLIRAFHIRQRDIRERSDYFPIFQPFQKSRLPQDGGLGDGSAPDDQRASVYFNWHFPVSNSLFYGEFSRTDHASDIRDFYLQPNHARAFLLGFNKRFTSTAGSAWSISAELTDISNTNPSRVRLWRAGQPAQDLFFYVHTAGLHHGHNHLGREIGSHYGMGSSAWFLSAQRKGQSIDYGLMVEYVRRNRVTFLAYSDEFGDAARQQLDMTLGGYVTIPLYDGLADFKLSMYSMHIRNQYYMPVIQPDGVERYRNIQNWNISLTLVVNLDQFSNQ